MFSVRLPKDLLERMRERKDVNWARVIRESICRVINEPVIPLTIENLICSLRDSGCWEMLLCLYLKAELFSPQYVARNLDIIYPGRAGEIISKLDLMLREHGLDSSLSGSSGGRSLRDLVKEGLLMHGVYDKFEMDIREKISKEGYDVERAAWLLSQYFVKDPYEWREYSPSIEPHGFIRTLSIMLDKENVIDIIKKLVKIGLIFWDYYESKAYSHEIIREANYASSFFSELFARNRVAVSLSDENLNFLAFLKWLVKNGADFRAVVEYEENEAKREFEGSKPFDEILRDLVKRGIVIIDYWPHRRRAGKRSSMPPYWVYRLTPSAKREVLPLLLIALIKREP